MLCSPPRKMMPPNQWKKKLSEKMESASMRNKEEKKERDGDYTFPCELSITQKKPLGVDPPAEREAGMRTAKDSSWPSTREPSKPTKKKMESSTGKMETMTSFRPVSPEEDLKKKRHGDGILHSSREEGKMAANSGWPPVLQRD
ncbi:unnamed protein product [Linum trigynum]|uniref:Uncharacterized protein n=1 Tax=Linum trigynum TaxID=586398 RepID=A0AAV2DGD4_9ROSI